MEVELCKIDIKRAMSFIKESQNRLAIFNVGL